jgi:hypothetical protein
LELELVEVVVLVDHNQRTDQLLVQQEEVQEEEDHP